MWRPSAEDGHRAVGTLLRGVAAASAAIERLRLSHSHVWPSLFRPWSEVLLERSAVAAGERLLDVACGTGIVARLAMARLSGPGSVVGVDVSAEMLAVARRESPAIDWREGNASALPLSPGEQFDVVVCHQGLRFFPDRAAALGEMRRATKPGGRLLVAVWKSLDETPFFQDLSEVAQRRLGTFVDRRHAFGDPGALGRLIADAGFDHVRVLGPSVTIRLAAPRTFLHLNSRAVVGMSGAASTMNQKERAQLADLIAEESAHVVQRYTDDKGVAFELGANIATALARNRRVVAS